MLTLVCWFWFLVPTPVFAELLQCGSGSLGFVVGDRAGCLCSLNGSAPFCLDKDPRTSEVFRWARQIAGSNNLQGTSTVNPDNTSIESDYGCCRSLNGSTIVSIQGRPAMVAACGDLLGFCDPGKSGRACCRYANCDSCGNYVSCGITTPVTTKSVSTLSTTVGITQFQATTMSADARTTARTTGVVMESITTGATALGELSTRVTFSSESSSSTTTLVVAAPVSDDNSVVIGVIIGCTVAFLLVMGVVVFIKLRNRMMKASQHSENDVLQTNPARPGPPAALAQPNNSNYDRIEFLSPPNYMRQAIMHSPTRNHYDVLSPSEV